MIALESGWLDNPCSGDDPDSGGIIVVLQKKRVVDDCR